MRNALTLLLVAASHLAPWFVPTARALEYPYAPYNEGKMDPQKTGWPLTEEERTYVLKAEHERRPGWEVNQHKPALWPVTPSAGFWGGTSWLDTHANLVEYVKANQGPIDVLLVGDSITQQWGSPLDTGTLNAVWKKHCGHYKTINVGIGGDKAQNVLWRLDHGGVEGLQPRAVLVMIGNNNMFFTPETDIEPAAKGIQTVVANVREKFPQATVIVAKILPAHAPGNRFYEDIKKTNLALDPLNLDGDPQVQVLDLTADFTNADGSLKKALFTADNIHLSPAGYSAYAERLKPLLDRALGGQGLGGDVVLPRTKAASAPSPAAPSTSGPNKASTASAVLPGSLLQPTPKTADGKGLVYPYAPYNEGKLDPQLTGWQITIRMAQPDHAAALLPGT
jgi:lysophospholipase L1-like esterase